MYSGKSGCNRSKVVVFEQKVVIQAKWLYSSKGGCIREKSFYSGKSV